MVSGDPTLINHGTFNVSGSELKTKIDGITEYHPVLSGAQLQLVPLGFGQVQLLEISVEGAG